MRSLGFTFFLALTALAACGLAGWTFIKGNLDDLFGPPPSAAGSLLFPDFSPGNIDRLHIRSGDALASFVKTGNAWQADHPWEDRMDPRAVVAIFQFTQGLSVQDRAPAGETDPAQTGLGDDAIQIRMESSDGTTSFSYRIGKRTPWLAGAAEAGDPVPTVFVQPSGSARSNHVYSCTGDILPLFKDSLRYFRDHHPFLPQPLRKIRIRGAEGELTLARESHESPWRITKPLELSTDPAAMKRLIDGLVELKAITVSDRADGTLPPSSNNTPGWQIGVTTFGSEEETTLEIHSPESPESRTTSATVSDRPGAIFELPLKPEADLVSLADLPLSVNELRNPTLTNLNIQSIASIAIRPLTSPEILIGRSPPQPWSTTINGLTSPANEQRLYSLLKAVTSGRVIGFETDAATDFSPWGLDRPFLRLLFLSHDHQTLELSFGLDSRGEIFVNRTGTPTVMRIDRLLLDQITTRTHEWRHSRLWVLNRVYLIGIKRTVPGEPPLELTYSFNPENWTARIDGEDVSARIDPLHANFLLESMEAPEVLRWLDQDDPAAVAALENPSLVLETVENITDDFGDATGVAYRTLEFAPAPERPGNYYGRLAGEPHPFLIDGQTYTKFATDPLE